MNSVAAAFPGRELHVIVDNLTTHKKNARWLKKHPNVHFHFTPTRSSWLNQIEIWFSILQGQSLNGVAAVPTFPRSLGKAQCITSPNSELGAFIALGSRSMLSLVEL